MIFVFFHVNTFGFLGIIPLFTARVVHVNAVNQCMWLYLLCCSIFGDQRYYCVL